VTTNLRICLTILSVGFAVEGISELYSLAAPSANHAGLSVLFLLPTVMTVVGVLFVWVGRHEWGELHRRRTGQATAIFTGSVVGGVIAGAVVALLAVDPSLGIPSWAKFVFGAGVASLLLGTFVTYAYLVFHLVGGPSKAALTVAVLWSFVISVPITLILAGDLPTLLHQVESRTPSVPAFLSPVDSLISYLFLSYFLLFAAYVEAHIVVARGPPPQRGRPAPTPSPGPPQ
jgi:hypothetical protein